MYFVYLVASETRVTIYKRQQFLKYVIFGNMMLIWVSYSENNCHVVAVVLQEASLKMRPHLSLKFMMFQYVH